LHLRRRNVLDVMPDTPTMAERVANGSRTLTVELVANLPFDLGAGFDRPADRLVGVVDMNVNHNVRRAGRVWTLNAVLGEFVGQHHGRAPKVQLRVSDPPARLGQSKLLSRTEGLCVKFDSRIGILDVQIREQFVYAHGVLLS